jgi:hypothetical protein
MPQKTEAYNLLEEDWNVLNSCWLEIVDLNAESQVYSPFEALKRASEIRCIAAASPLDLFAAHRFLLTLLYWKADMAGGVIQVRESLLSGEVPASLLNNLRDSASSFRMFDDQVPFLQDLTARNTKKPYSAGSLFSEFAVGTNIAHFHHGDDKRAQLCLRCTTFGMLRVVPWSQQGGQGLSAAIHKAPPIIALALGSNLAETLGLNLVTLDIPAGEAHWSGHYEPLPDGETIPYMEGFTWNPRRIHLGKPTKVDICWYCGQRGTVGIGKIVYKKNDYTKSRAPKWKDPAAFYKDEKFKAMTSGSDVIAAEERDIGKLIDKRGFAYASVVQANPDHRGWILIVPSTPGNAKTYDHRVVDLQEFSTDSILRSIPKLVKRMPSLPEGWQLPARSYGEKGIQQFIQAATNHLSDGDWSKLAGASLRAMQERPAAFNLLAGLYWSLKEKHHLPSHGVAWLLLKLLAQVPRGYRNTDESGLNPLHNIPMRQKVPRRAKRVYPLAFPSGYRLEATLQSEIKRNIRHPYPQRFNWVQLCVDLNQLVA